MKEFDIEATSKDSKIPLRVTVLGGGSFGTAMANLAARSGSQTTLWIRKPEVAEEINRTHCNARYLPDLQLEPTLFATSDLKEAVENKDIIFVAVPSVSFRQILKDIHPFITGQAVVSLTKGVEPETFALMSQIIEAELPQVVFGVLSGPNLAKEIALGQPAGTVIASASGALRSAVHLALTNPTFRVFGSDDVNGVELAGALKNIYAVAMGIANAYKLGENAKSLLLTRALAEMSRYASAMGANPLTFLGLAGVGDLFATCNSPLSRNYQIGFALGSGKSLEQAIADLGQTAEGINTIRQVSILSKQKDIYMPITQALYQVVYEGANPLEAAMNMMKNAGQRSDVEYVLPNS